MNTWHRTLLSVAACAVVAACGKSEPPPPPPAPPPKVAPAPPPNPNDALKRIAGEAYVYAYPLVLMDVTREIATARVPMNTFDHERRTADASSKGGPYPNPDVLYSRAWLDLGKEPVVLSFPDSRDRYYVMPMLDAWTNVFSSPGVRTTGTDKRDFAVVGPFFKGALPDELTPIKAPTDLVWVVGRIGASGKGGGAAGGNQQETENDNPPAHAI
jgi:hypothetical protein